MIHIESHQKIKVVSQNMRMIVLLSLFIL